MGSVMAYDALCRSGSTRHDLDNDFDHRAGKEESYRDAFEELQNFFADVCFHEDSLSDEHTGDESYLSASRLLTAPSGNRRRSSSTRYILLILSNHPFFENS